MLLNQTVKIVLLLIILLPILLQSMKAATEQFPTDIEQFLKVVAPSMQLSEVIPSITVCGLYSTVTSR